MRRHLTFANVGSTIALFAVLAGGVAFGLPGKKTVQANDLRKNSVKAIAIAKNAVRSAEIQDGAITGAKVADLGLAYENLGSNSVVTRLTLPAPVASGDATPANPKIVPLTGAPWPQAGNETQVFFGSAGISAPTACGNNGSLQVEVWVDGESFDLEYFQPDDPPTMPMMFDRPYIFEPGSPTTHTAELRVSDSCQNAGEQLVLERAHIIAVGMR
jgi:hypothetical protein